MITFLPRKLIFLLVISWWFGSAQAGVKSPLPEIVKLQWQGLEMIGQTTLKRFGFHIYDASFWMFEDQLIDATSKNIRALSITYARDIRAKNLLSSTKKEWERLGFAEQYSIDAWLGDLKNIWPDVAKGDQLIAVTQPEGKTTFFNSQNILGTIHDSDFGAAFLAIWLDENSRFTKNRKELLGE